MKNQTMDNSAEAKSSPINFEVLEWRCVNGHLLARFLINQILKLIAIQTKCHRCKHIETKEMRSIEQ